MGASKYKRVRAEERTAGVSPREQAKLEQEKKDKKSKTLYTVIGVVLVVLAVFAFVVNTSIFDTRFAAVRIGDESFSAADVRYAKQSAYSDFYNEYSSLLSYLLDPDKPLDEQECLFDSEMTWDEYFTEQGLNYLQQTSVFYNAAVAEGYTLSEEEEDIINQNTDLMAAYAKSYGYTTDGYIAAMYGKGNNVKSVRRMMERGFLASDYASDKREALSASYTEADLDAYYEEHRDDYNTVNYLYAAVPVADGDADGATDANAKEMAMGIAEAIAAETKDSADSFREAVLANMGTDPYETSSSLSGMGENREWFADAARKEGDTFISDDETSIRVYCYLSAENNQYNTMSVRHILVKAVDADGDGAYSDAEKQVALESLKDIESQWDGSEQNFIELVEEYSEDQGSNTNGGLYENIYKGMMVEEFNDFCFSGAKNGETAIVYGESPSYAGYHLIYMVGEGESYARVLARNGKTGEEYADWQSSMLEGKEIEKTSMFRYL